MKLIWDFNYYYKERELLGYHGKKFQTIQRAWKISSMEIVGELLVPDDYYKYYIHPAVLDGAIQLGGFLGRRRLRERVIKRWEIMVFSSIKN
jgi:hypothetical protein